MTIFIGKPDTYSLQHTVAKGITFIITYTQMLTEGKALHDQVFATIKCFSEK